MVFASSAQSAESAPAYAGPPNGLAQDHASSAHVKSGARRIFRSGQLDNIKFPLGGIGAGMMCLEGAGGISSVSIRSRPELLNNPCLFAALSLAHPASVTKVLEGPVAAYKVLHQPLSTEGGGGTTYGLPRFSEAAFSSEFPFAEVELRDPLLPVVAKIVGWSPFEPLDADASSLPFASLEYELTNVGPASLEALFSFHSHNFLASSGPLSVEKDAKHGIRKIDTGFILWTGESADHQQPDAALSIVSDDAEAEVGGWFRGHAFDALTMAWRSACGLHTARFALESQTAPHPGASLFVPVELAPGQSRIIRIRFAWHVVESCLRAGDDPDYSGETRGHRGRETYQPWYHSQFHDIDASTAWWRDHFDDLRRRTARFRDCFFSSTVAHEVIEAVSANLSLFKSPTMLRQADGRFWGWEGLDDESGNGYGSCTHVWNYAQSMAHLFPALERTMRETELNELLFADGHQNCRVPLPIRKPLRSSARLADISASSPAPDGQLGGIIRTFRDWRISGDTDWLRRLWPLIRLSLDHCIRSWDPKRSGCLDRPRLNTYDVVFWSPDIRDGGLYLGALKAAALMAEALGEDSTAYTALFDAGSHLLNTRLFNGEYFQQLSWSSKEASTQDLADMRIGMSSAEDLVILAQEGPKYQYGRGCLTDALLGEWLAQLSGCGALLDTDKVRNHLSAVFRHNFKMDLSLHANPQRPKYALGREGGTLLCTWPHGGEPSFPFIYSNEVWTGLEYEAASHLIMTGMVEEGLAIVRACRQRHDGTVRNPFDDFEAGRWYARSMSCYALLQALSGARFDAVHQVLYLKPSVPGDFRCFLSTASGYGVVGVKDGRPFVENVVGTIPYARIEYVPCA